MNKSQLIVLEECVIEILHNEFLTKKPYLIRVANFEYGDYEFRADKKDLEKLLHLINKADQE